MFRGGTGIWSCLLENLQALFACDFFCEILGFLAVGTPGFRENYDVIVGDGFLR